MLLVSKSNHPVLGAFSTPSLSQVFFLASYSPPQQLRHRHTEVVVPVDLQRTEDVFSYI